MLREQDRRGKREKEGEPGMSSVMETVSGLLGKPAAFLSHLGARIKGLWNRPGRPDCAGAGEAAWETAPDPFTQAMGKEVITA